MAIVSSGEERCPTNTVQAVIVQRLYRFSLVSSKQWQGWDRCTFFGCLVPVSAKLLVWWSKTTVLEEGLSTDTSWESRRQNVT
jgi:hypothetical protein